MAGLRGDLGDTRAHMARWLALAVVVLGYAVAGVVLDRWPQTPSGYAPEAYPWALALLWSVQLAGLLFLIFPSGARAR